jgi:hypothetical protein
METDRYDAARKEAAEILAAHASSKACRRPYKVFGFFHMA